MFISFFKLNNTLCILYLLMDDDDASIISSENTTPAQLHAIFKLIDKNSGEDYNIISLFNIEILRQVLEYWWSVYDTWQRYVSESNIWIYILP